MTTVGVIGLGNMGSVLAGNLVGAGFDVVTHDHVGAATNPEGARFVDSIAEVASSAVVQVWQGFAAEHPDVDFTRIFSFLRGSDVP